MPALTFQEIEFRTMCDFILEHPPFEISTKDFQETLNLSGDFQNTLLNGREGGMPMMFEMETIPVTGSTEYPILKFWRLGSDRST
jgi:hypothetical protein